MTYCTKKVTPHVRPSLLLSSRSDLPPCKFFLCWHHQSSLEQLHTHLCQLHHVSKHDMCNFTMTFLLYIQVLGVNIEATPQVNIKLVFPCGCEAPRQAKKSHHQTHEAPTQVQGEFSPNRKCDVVPTTIPTCPTPRVMWEYLPEATKINRNRSSSKCILEEITHSKRRDSKCEKYYNSIISNKIWIFIEAN